MYVCLPCWHGMALPGACLSESRRPPGSGVAVKRGNTYIYIYIYI